MKTTKEIEELAEIKYFHVDGFEEEISESKRHWIGGYTQCQEDMADKKYTKEDVINAFNEGQALNVRGKLIQGKDYINSLNGQD